MIDEIKEVPCLPQVSMELIRQAFQEEPEIHKLASIMEKDPNLCANLFKTVNSAAFGPKVEISDINQAISLMGLDMLRSTVVSLAVGDYFNSNFSGNALDVKSFCVHSLATAVIIREIAQSMNIREANQLYLLGLLHDLGQIVLDSLPGQDYTEVLDRVKQGKRIDEAEWEVYNCNNRQVWQFLARSWGFPKEIIELFKGSVKGTFTASTRKLVEDSSRIADTLGYYFIHPFARGGVPESNIIAAVSKESFLTISSSVEKQVEAMGEVLDLPSPDNAQIKEILLTATHQLTLRVAENVKARHRYEIQVDLFDQLLKLLPAIADHVEGETLAFSVVKALLKDFSVDGAFLLSQDAKGNFSGQGALCRSEGEPDFEQLLISKDQLTPSILKTIQGLSPEKVIYPAEEEGLRKCLGDVAMAWLAPVLAKGRLIAVLGVGVLEKKDRRVLSSEFGSALDLVAREVGLCLEIARLSKCVQQPVLS